MSKLSSLVTVLALAAAPTAAVADTYSIFHPRPRTAMREMSTDRPDTTESPISVDAGHVQAELDLVALGFTGSQSTVDVANANLKVGLTSAIDLQLVIEPYHREAIDAAMTSSGYGGTTVRLKTNLWGNDGGATAAALLPFVSRAEGAWSGGLAIPIGFELPGGVSSAVMPELDLADVDGAVEATGMFTATASHDLFGPVGMYAEAAVHVEGAAAGDVAMQADGGFTFGVSPDVQFDVGTRVGLFGDVPDAEMFLGVAARR